MVNIGHTLTLRMYHILDFDLNKDYVLLFYRK